MYDPRALALYQGCGPSCQTLIKHEYRCLRQHGSFKELAMHGLNLCSPPTGRQAEAPTARGRARGGGEDIELHLRFIHWCLGNSYVACLCNFHLPLPLLPPRPLCPNHTLYTRCLLALLDWVVFLVALCLIYDEYLFYFLPSNLCLINQIISPLPLNLSDLMWYSESLTSSITRVPRGWPDSRSRSCSLVLHLEVFMHSCHSFPLPVLLSFISLSILFLLCVSTLCQSCVFLVSCKYSFWCQRFYFLPSFSFPY